VNIDLENLDFKNAGNWPFPIKIVAIVAVAIAVGFAGYWFDTKEQLVALDNARAKEEELKKTFETKQAVAANLDAYKKQMEEMKKSFGALLLQLPSKTEVAELLVDISRVGLESGLEFELFKPGSETVKEFYAEYPISIRVVGSYHQLGNFVGGIAALPRIVTLHNLKINKRQQKAKKGEKAGDSVLLMNATANTYRYLDKGELDAQNARKKKSKKRKK